MESGHLMSATHSVHLPGPEGLNSGPRFSDHILRALYSKAYASITGTGSPVRVFQDGAL